MQGSCDGADVGQERLQEEMGNVTVRFTQHKTEESNMKIIDFL